MLSPTASTQTSTTLSYNTPRKKKFREDVKKLRNQNTELRKQVEELKETSKNVTLEEYLALTYKFCPSKKLADFINVQVSQCQKNPKGRRYSEEFKYECLKLYFTGPKLYKTQLMQTFCLPSTETLLKIIRPLTSNTGLNNPKLFDMIKMKVSSFKEQNKYCVLCIDEMSIKANLFYDRTTDSVVGLAENEKNEKIFKPALSACLLMLRGIYSRWKQPVAYYLPHTTCPGTSLKNIIFETVEKVSSTGLNICVLTTDMGSNNIQLSNLLNVSPDMPHFYVNDKQIMFMFDIPHIIKAIRNMLLKYDFVVDENVISWKFIVMFYEHDKQHPLRAAPKLTDAHINPSNFDKMKVKFATQVFSATVSASLNLYIRFGFLPAQAVYTADFIDRMDKLFDLLNSSHTIANKIYNRAFKGLEFQISFLQDCLNFFDKLEVRTKKNINISHRIKFLKCIKISIKGLLILWTNLHLKGNYSYLFTRRLNNDDLENLIGKFRQVNGQNTNPTSIQFKRSFKKLQCLSLMHSGTENCEADKDPILLKLHELSQYETVLNEPPLSTSSLQSDETSFTVESDYQKDKLLQENFVRYICGYLLRKASKLHSCPICTQYENAHKELDETSMYIFFRAYQNTSNDVFGNLRNPHDDFIKFITCIEALFQLNFENFILLNDICRSFINASKNIAFVHPCPQFPMSYITNLYFRVRIYYTLKNINKNFRTINKNKLIIWHNQ